MRENKDQKKSEYVQFSRSVTDILKCLFLYDLFIFFYVLQMLALYKAKYLSLLRIGLWGSEVSILFELINIVFILYYIRTKFNKLLYTFLIVLFA